MTEIPTDYLGPSGKKGLARWAELTHLRRPLMDRLEKYAAATLPRIMLPAHTSEFTESTQHDSQSIGAQGVNHMSSKMMMALFRPGAPFFRTDPDRATREALAASGISEDDIRDGIVGVERDALKVLDTKALRPMLHEAMLHLITVGNILLDLSGDTPEIEGLQNYAVRRNKKGEPVEIMRLEYVTLEDLEDDVVEQLSGTSPTRVMHFLKHYTRRGKTWTLRQYVDNLDLGDKFMHTWSLASFEVHPLVWNLPLYRHYGTGLVEDYAGDFALLSTLTDSEIALAIRASEYRWVAHPAGVTSVEDFRTSANGSVVSGRPEDIAMVGDDGRAGQAIQSLGVAIDRAVRRVAGAFLLNSAITRNAERVTAEEIRQQAEELDTANGGIYSRLAVSLQGPLARFLLRAVDMDIKGTKLVLSIVTGTDAMSRSTEAYQSRLFLEDLAGLSTLGESVPELNRAPIIQDFAAARGLRPSRYIKTPAQLTQERQSETDMMTNATVTENAAKAAAASASKGNQ